jgi:tetratricopeptide (TPR) repeat protein
MEILSTYVIYLAVFRLAIIAAGIVGIILGYRLFAKGVFPNVDPNPSTDGQNVTAEIAGAKFSLRNAAPGTCFALFGVIIIAAMFATGGPEITLELLEKGGMKANLRGNDLEEIQSHSKQAIEYLKQGDHRQARETVIEALQALAPRMNDFAWVLLQTAPELPQANMLAELATTAEPQNPNFLHTLAEIQFKNGRKQEAIRTLEKARLIDPSHSEQLQRWRSEISGN